MGARSSRLLAQHNDSQWSFDFSEIETPQAYHPTCGVDRRNIEGLIRDLDHHAGAHSLAAFADGERCFSSIAIG
jgi:hypothetical protein